MKTLRSPDLASIFAVVTASVALGTSGCYFGDGGTPADGSDTSRRPAPGSTSTAPADAVRVSIDSGASVPATPGERVGIYVEATGDGHWNVFTTCDSSASGAPCSFDLNVSPQNGAKLSGIAGNHLAYGDAMTTLDDGTIQLVSQTSYAATGISFDTDPGALIKVNVLLDGVPQVDLVHWVSGGMVRDGAPSNPVVFVPKTP